MHLLIILLQQLLGMLPSSKQVPQPEVVRNGGNPNNGEADAFRSDACQSIALPFCGWLTPFRRLHLVAQPMFSVAASCRAADEDSPRCRKSIRPRTRSTGARVMRAVLDRRGRS